MGSDLIGLIKAKQAEVAKLQAELEEAKALLAGKSQAAAPVRAPGPSNPKKPSATTRQPGKAATEPRSSNALPEGSAAAWAADAIRSAGRPLHVTDMVKGIEQRGHKVKLNTLVGSLSRWVQRKVFYRTGPNVFGLTEMRKA